MYRAYSRQLSIAVAVFLVAVVVFGHVQVTHAEGSRNLFPPGTPGFRTNLFWKSGGIGPNNMIARRMLLNVYAQAGEVILIGSSAVGISNLSTGTFGELLLYAPGSVTGEIGAELIGGSLIPNPATALVDCRNDQPGAGYISSRAQELAGPQAMAGGGNPGGYTPCSYQVPAGAGGIYHVVISGPNGLNSEIDGTVTGEIELGSATNFNASQGNAVAAWDVTVRSDPNSVTNIDGRLYTNYVIMNAGGNGRPTYFSLYTVTLDGYVYLTDMNGLDPWGFLTFGNELGFLDTDGATPLYRNVVAAPESTGAGGLNTIAGGVTMQRPQFPMFFVDSPAQRNVVLPVLGIPTDPIQPTVSNLSFIGEDGNTTRVGVGGTFQFDTNIEGRYELVISRNTVTPNYDPTLPENRVLRGIANPGTNTFSWDGLDNAGTPFPVGTNYPFELRTRAGEYHFPMVDAENSTNGGPSITLINPPDGNCAAYPNGCDTAFYDDRGYVTLNGNSVGTLNTLLCGVNPPAVPVSDLINGFDSTSNQRGWGTATDAGNVNLSCLPPTNGNGSFGDAKGLNLWTYYPSNMVENVLNIVDDLLTATPTDTPTETPTDTPTNTPVDTPTGTLSPTPPSGTPIIITTTPGTQVAVQPSGTPVIGRDLSISKLGFMLPNGQVQWTITVSNNTSVVNTNVVVTDTIIDSLRIDGVDAPGGSVTINGQTVTVTYASLQPGESRIITISTTALRGTSFNNTACTTADNVSDPRCANAIAIRELPATGELPWYRTPLLVGLAALVLGLLFTVARRLQRSGGRI